MPIISFDDNSVIDMGVMQEMANAINAHDDLLTSFTNSLSQAAAEQDTESVQNNILNFTKHNVFFGRNSIQIINGSSVNGAGNVGEQITFPASFGATPIVIATPGHASDPDKKYVSTIYGVNTASFFVNVYRADEQAIGTGSIYVYWIAIGLKAGA